MKNAKKRNKRNENHTRKKKMLLSRRFLSNAAMLNPRRRGSVGLPAVPCSTPSSCARRGARKISTSVVAAAPLASSVASTLTKVPRCFSLFFDF